MWVRAFSVVAVVLAVATGVATAQQRSPPGSRQVAQGQGARRNAQKWRGWSARGAPPGSTHDPHPQHIACR